MTQLYVMARQDRDKYKQSLENVKKDVDQMDKIIKDNVERALKAREKQFNEVQTRLKESQERITQVENHKKCYSDTIKYLESQISEMREGFEEEKSKNRELVQQLKGKENQQERRSGTNFFQDEKARLKQLKAEDELMTQKMNDNEFVDETNFDIGGRGSMIGAPVVEKYIRTTEGDDCSYEEATNCRLREETNASMLFGANSNSVPVNLNQIKLTMSQNSSGKKKGSNQGSEAKVAPFNY